MRRYHEFVFLLVFLFSLTLFWAIRQEQTKPYKTYQKIYQVRKIEQLKARAEKESAKEKVDQILHEIRQLEETLPGVREIVLKDGSRERCLTCHIGLQPISDSHPVETFGCKVCHGGDPLSITLPAAHQGLIGGRNPSDFLVADQACGKNRPDGTACHNGPASEERNHLQRVKTTIMNTKAGEIAHPRFAFGAQKSPRPLYGVVAVQGLEPKDPDQSVPSLLPLPYTRNSDLPVDSEGRTISADLTGVPFTFSGKPVDTQLHQNCINQCHFWTRGKREPYLYRASGCASCHYLYEEESYYQGEDPTIRRDEPGHGPFHRLTLSIPYSQCNHCHNRGAHSLLTMEFFKRTDLQDLNGLHGEERRVKDYYNPMTLFTLCEYKLDCIDCHTDPEVMGDGFLHNDKKAQQRIRCYICHGTLEKPPIIRRLTGEEPAKIQRIMRSYSRNPGEKAMFTPQGEILPHVRLENERVYLTGKVTQKKFALPLVFGSRCTQDPNIQDASSCHACHDLQLKK